MLLVQTGRLSRVRMKPEHKTLEVNYDLDVRSDNFDAASEQHTERMRLLSRVVPPKTNYAVGMFRADGGGTCPSQYLLCGMSCCVGMCGCGHLLIIDRHSFCAPRSQVNYI